MNDMYPLYWTTIIEGCVHVHGNGHDLRHEAGSVSENNHSKSSLITAFADPKDFLCFQAHDTGCVGTLCGLQLFTIEWHPVTLQSAIFLSPHQVSNRFKHHLGKLGTAGKLFLLLPDIFNLFHAVKLCLGVLET